jgi:hypothetical protein
MTEYKFHAVADIFPLMTDEEFDALVIDIKANGLREKIDLYQGKIVDGRNRYRALLQLGIDPSADPKTYFRKAIYIKTVSGKNNDDAVRSYVISRNLHRRYLTAEQKRELIAKLLKAQPEQSDRQIAKQVKASHSTVAKARKEAEATGQARPVEKRVGADGKARKQPKKYDLERDRKECIALAQRVKDAERERDEFLKATASEDGKEWIDAGGNRHPKACECPAGTTATLKDRKPERIPTKAKAAAAEQHDLYETVLRAFECMTTKTRVKTLCRIVTLYEREVNGKIKVSASGNGADPEASAEAMKEKFAALDSTRDLSADA